MLPQKKEGKEEKNKFQHNAKLWWEMNLRLIFCRTTSALAPESGNQRSKLLLNTRN